MASLAARRDEHTETLRLIEAVYADEHAFEG
jgi:hypothetical protein